MRNGNEGAECRTAEEFVSYLYDELPAASRSLFEKHLLACGKCTDEFAELADSRYSVYEWRAVEFAPMETPVVAIPYGNPVRISTLDGLLASIRGLFASPKGWAVSGAFASVLIALAAAAFVFIGGDGGEIADLNASNGPSSNGPVPAAPSVPEGRSQETAATPNAEKPAFASDETRAGKAAAKFVEQRRPSKAVHIKAPAAPQPRIPTGDRRNAPRLNDFDDLGDDGLRLADLIEDIETSD